MVSSSSVNARSIAQIEKTIHEQQQYLQRNKEQVQQFDPRIAQSQAQLRGATMGSQVQVRSAEVMRGQAQQQAMQEVGQQEQQLQEYEKEFQQYLKSPSGIVQYAQESGAQPSVRYETVSAGAGKGKSFASVSRQVPVYTYTSPYGTFEDKSQLEAVQSGIMSEAQYGSYEIQKKDFDKQLADLKTQGYDPVLDPRGNLTGFNVEVPKTMGGEGKQTIFVTPDQLQNVAVTKAAASPYVAGTYIPQEGMPFIIPKGYTGQLPPVIEPPKPMSAGELKAREMGQIVDLSPSAQEEYARARYGPSYGQEMPSLVGFASKVPGALVTGLQTVSAKATPVYDAFRVTNIPAMIIAREAYKAAPFIAREARRATTDLISTTKRVAGPAILPFVISTELEATAIKKAAPFILKTGREAAIDIGQFSTAVGTSIAKGAKGTYEFFKPAVIAIDKYGPVSLISKAVPVVARNVISPTVMAPLVFAAPSIKTGAVDFFKPTPIQRAEVEIVSRALRYEGKRIKERWMQPGPIGGVIPETPEETALKRKAAEQVVTYGIEGPARAYDWYRGLKESKPISFDIPKRMTYIQDPLTREMAGGRMTVTPKGDVVSDFAFDIAPFFIPGVGTWLAAGVGTSQALRRGATGWERAGGALLAAGGIWGIKSQLTKLNLGKSILTPPGTKAELMLLNKQGRLSAGYQETLQTTYQKGMGKIKNVFFSDVQPVYKFTAQPKWSSLSTAAKEKLITELGKSGIKREAAIKFLRSYKEPEVLKIGYSTVGKDFLGRGKPASYVSTNMIRGLPTKDISNVAKEILPIKYSTLNQNTIFKGTQVTTKFPFDKSVAYASKSELPWGLKGIKTLSFPKTRTIEALGSLNKLTLGEAITKARGKVIGKYGEVGYIQKDKGINYAIRKFVSPAKSGKKDLLKVYVQSAKSNIVEVIKEPGKFGKTIRKIRTVYSEPTPLWYAKGTTPKQLVKIVKGTVTPYVEKPLRLISKETITPTKITLARTDTSRRLTEKGITSMRGKMFRVEPKSIIKKAPKPMKPWPSSIESSTVKTAGKSIMKPLGIGRPSGVPDGSGTGVGLASAYKMGVVQVSGGMRKKLVWDYVDEFTRLGPEMAQIKTQMLIPSPFVKSIVVSPKIDLAISKGLRLDMGLKMVSGLKVGQELVVQKQLMKVQQLQKLEVQKIEQLMKVNQIMKVDQVMKMNQVQKIGQIQTQVPVQVQIQQPIQIQVPRVQQPRITRPEQAPRIEAPRVPVIEIPWWLSEEQKKKRRKVSVSRIKRKGFEVLVRRRGTFAKVSPGALEFGQAIALGRKVTKETAAVTFKLVPSAAPIKLIGIPKITPGALSLEFRKPIRRGRQLNEPLTFIQKRKFRIATPGERRQITYLGIAKRKSQGRKVLW